MRLGQVSVGLRHAGAFGNKLVRGGKQEWGWLLWRGDLSPLGCAADRFFLSRMGPLRDPAGINPLAKGVCSVLEEFDHAACGVGGDFDQPAVAVQLQAIMPTEL